MWEAPSTGPPLIHRRMSPLLNPPAPFPVVGCLWDKTKKQECTEICLKKKRIAQCTLLIEELQESISSLTRRALTFSDPYHQANGNLENEDKLVWNVRQHL